VGVAYAHNVLVLPVHMGKKGKGSPYSITKYRISGADPSSWQSACR